MAQRLLSWCALVFVTLLGAGTGVRAEDPAPAAPANPAATPAAPAPAPVDEGDELEGLMPFGIRVLGNRLKALGTDPGPRLKMIDDALKWLAAHQGPDGLWLAADLSWCNGQKQQALVRMADGAGKEVYDIGVTGLVLLAFLAAGHDHLDGGPYAQSMGRGLTALVSVQDPEGCFGPRTTQHYIYNHGFAIQAVVEAFAVTGDRRLRAPAQRGLAFALLARNPFFGWRYGVSPGENDVSVTVLMLMGLSAAWTLNESAAAAGLPEPLNLPPLRPASDEDHPFRGGLAWLDRMTDEYGRAGYIQRGSGPARTMEDLEKYPTDKSEAMTAAALAARLLMPREVPRAKNEETLVKRGFGLLSGLPPRWNTGDGSIDLYYWYYAAVAFAARGGPEAKAFDAALLQALSTGQRKTGGVCDVLGSWDPLDPWRADGGRFYMTALCVLSLAAPGWHGRRALDPKEVAARLSASEIPAAERRRLVRAIALHRIPGMESALLAASKSTDEGLRAVALAALAASDPSSKGVQVLTASLADPSLTVKVAAARAVARLAKPDPSLVEPLRALLSLPDPTVRIAASHALARFGPGALPALAELVTMTSDPQPLVRLGGAKGLLGIDPTSAPAALVLVEGMKSADAAVRAEAARVAVAHQGPDEALSGLLKQALGDKETRVATHAAIACRRRGISDDRIPGRLVAGLDGADVILLGTLLDEIAAVGAPARSGTAKVADRAHRGSSVVRLSATRALARIGGTEAVAHYHALLQDPNPEVKRVAEEALAALGLAPPALADALAARLATRDPDEARGARAGLVALGVGAVPALQKVLGTPAADAGALRLALEVVGVLGPKARDLSPLVAGILMATGDAEVAVAAADAIADVGAAPPQALEALEKFSLSQDTRLHGAGLRALGSLAATSPDAVAVLVRILKDASVAEPNRMAALRVAGGAGANATPLLPVLMEFMAKPTGDPWRTHAVASLAKLGPHFIPVLKNALKEGREPPLSGVLEAIAAMGAGAVPLAGDLTDRFKSTDGDPHSGLVDAALVVIGEPVVKPLLKAYPRMVPGREGRLVRLFGAIGPPAKDALPFLEKMAKSRDADLSNAARQAMDRIRAK